MFAIGIPTINRADLLKSLLIDLNDNMPGIPVLVLDNGGQVIKIPENCAIPTLLHMKENIGVAASWNEICKHIFYFWQKEYALILNDDIILGKKTSEIIQAIQDNEKPYILTHREGWTSFLISKECFEDIGGFDENFYPCGFEDDDYTRRIMLEYPGHERQFANGPPRVNGYGFYIKISPVLAPVSHVGGASRIADGTLAANQASVHYKEKWGGGPSAEKYTEPFNGREK
jgi:GT2 family glycosyltransferase